MLTAQLPPRPAAEYLPCPQDFLDLYFLGCKVRRATLPLHSAQGSCMHSLRLRELRLRGTARAAALPPHNGLAGSGCIVRFCDRLQACLRRSKSRQVVCYIL